jgi:hypothetical protein
VNVEAEIQAGPRPAQPPAVWKSEALPFQPTYSVMNKTWEMPFFFNFRYEGLKIVDYSSLVNTPTSDTSCHVLCLTI